MTVEQLYYINSGWGIEEILIIILGGTDVYTGTVCNMPCKYLDAEVITFSGKTICIR